MKRQKGFGLIMILISVAIIMLSMFGAFYVTNTDDVVEGETKVSSIEKQLNAVDQAEDIKNILENRNRGLCIGGNCEL